MQRTKDALAAFKSDSSQIDAVFAAAAQDIVEHVGATRASVWAFNETGDRITALALYDSRDGSMHKGAVLSEADFPEYFAAIQRDRKIVAVDASTHPGTACFDELYFIPNDIRSLLDHAIYVGDEPVAVLCCEHCGVMKEWTDADMDRLHQMASVLGLTLRVYRKTPVAA